MNRQIHALFAAVLLSVGACTTPPTKVIQTACTRNTQYSTERCAKGIAETYEVYQKRAEGLALAPTTPEDVRKAVKKADAAATPVMVELLKSTSLYATIKLQLGQGTTAEQLAVANANLESWIARALPLIDSFRKALNGETR